MTPGSFASTGSMATARSRQTASLLTNGRVLVAGGFGAISAAELFDADPATGSFSSTGSMGLGRSDRRATLLNDGRVLVTGRRDNSA